MKRDEVLRVLSAHDAELRDFGVERLAVFGSVARDETRPESDVDILVEFRGKATFDGYMDLEFVLESVLDRSVDLVTRKSLKRRLAPAVEEEALYIS